MAVITLGHAALIAVALLARAPLRDDAPPEPIAVSLLTGQHSEPPAPVPRPPEVVMPEVVVPMLNIEIAQDAAPPPIAVVVESALPTPPAPLAPAVSSGDPGAPIMATSVEYVRAPVLVYPAAAKQARASGTVHIRAVVEADGRVREVHVDRSSGYSSLDKAASESMLAALFKPYTLNGVPRAAVVIVPMDFGVKVRGARRGQASPEERCDKPHRRDRDDDSCGPDREPPFPRLNQPGP